LQLPGTLIEGKYEILGKIHEGGMGTIYKVRHRLLDEIRVVKVMKPSITADAEMKSRFADEAKMATRLKHPNIGTIHDFSLDEDGTAYLVMEYIDGVNLAELLASKGSPDLSLALEIAHQSLLALGYLHRRNVIHRDVAPDNLMLTHDEEGHPRVKLIDLGIAKALDRPIELTSAGVFLGKLKYASPEQYGALPAGEKLDGRSDLYCLGVVLYELMTNVRPFVGDTPAEMLRAHLFNPPVPFEESDPKGKVPVEIRKVILRSLEKKREDRYPTAEEFDREIVAMRHSYGTALDSTVQILSAVRQTPVSPDAQTITPSAQGRLDRQFMGPTTPAASRPRLSSVPALKGEMGGIAKPPLIPRRPAVAGILGGAAALLVIGLLVTRPWETRRKTAPVRSSPPVSLAPTAAPQAVEREAASAPTVPAPTESTVALETTAPPRATAPAPSDSDRAAAEEARRLAGRARSKADRAGAAAKAPGPYGAARRAESDGARLAARGKFSAARAAFEKSAESYAAAETAAVQLSASQVAQIAPAHPPAPTAAPPPTPRPEPTRAAVAAAPIEAPAPSIPTAPVKAGPSEQDRVRDVLKEYERAHNTLNVDLYARVFPTFVTEQRQNLDRAWQGLRSQHLELEIRQLDVNRGQAVVRAYQRLTAVPQAGTEQRDAREVIFRLEKRGESWVITERR
jgi:eukaryotic-like serine/threonine-protein kinase